MVALPNTYKPAEVEAASGGSSVPPGKYKAVLLGSCEKPNSNGTGSHVLFEFQVIDGPQKGSTIQDRFNFNNTNPKAVEIAFAQFKALAIACGKEGATDTDLLTNSIVVITYGPQKTNPQYNEVKKYEPSTASTEGYVAPAVTQPAAQSTAATGTTGKPSWA